MGPFVLSTRGGIRVDSEVGRFSTYSITIIHRESLRSPALATRQAAEGAVLHDRIPPEWNATVTATFELFASPPCRHDEKAEHCSNKDLRNKVPFVKVMV